VTERQELRIRAVGDLCFADHPLCRGFGVAATAVRCGEAGLFAHVRDQLGQADLLFGNLETVLSAPPSGADADATAFRSSATLADVLREVGFDVLNVANNHALQHGEAAFAGTADLLAAARIGAVGRVAEDGTGCRAEVLERRGWRIGVLGYSEVREDHVPGQRSYAHLAGDRVLDEIRALAARVDLVVVSCHWGLELADRPPAGVVGWARAMVDAGADLVLGHHPHVWQGVERRGTGLIFYSLGDFVFDLAWCRPCRRTGIADVVFRPGREPQWSCLPVAIGADHRPEPASPAEARSFREWLAGASREAESSTAAAPGSPPTPAELAAAAAAARSNQWAKVRHLVRHAPRLGPRFFWRLVRERFRRSSARR
jgi:poly-gamma-glutamate synthesis protein (capsule biosynthesis protein)